MLLRPSHKWLVNGGQSEGTGPCLRQVVVSDSDKSSGWKAFSHGRWKKTATRFDHERQKQPMVLALSRIFSTDLELTCS
jgi:hypothetical protein